MPPQRQKRLHLRRNQQPAIHERIVERLDAIPVASSEEDLAFGVPQHEGEFPAEVRHERQAVVAVQREDDLAVAAALEVVFRVQVGAVALVVVQLAVDDGVDVVLPVVEGLVAVRAEVDDREADVAESWTNSQLAQR